MKKLFGCIVCVLLFVTNSYAQISTQRLPKEIKLDVTFDWQQPNAPFNNEIIHVKKTIELHPGQSNYTVITSDTKADDRLPTTWALLVKPTDINHHEMTAYFMLVQYGLNHNGEIIAQPKIIFLNGQTAEMLLSGDSRAMKIKVYGKWS